MRAVFIILIFSSSLGFAQNWIWADTIVDNAVTAFFADTSDNSFYIGGRYKRLSGADTIVSIAKYKNGQWIRMGDGVDWPKSIPWCASCVPNPVRSIIKYRDTIYITGEFSYSGNTTLNGIGKWDGSKWKNIGSGLKDSLGVGGVGYKFKIFNNELYLAGGFDSISGISAHGLAKFNGTNWSSVKSIPKIYYFNIIKDVEIYNGEIFVAGTMNNNSSIRGIMKWNGAQWVNPGISIYGLGYIMGLTTYLNRLYVLGSFSNTNDSPLNPGDCIVRYDGSGWEKVGAGVVWTNSLARIHAYKIHKGKMYLGGAFDRCNNSKVDGVAVFDGERFCSLDTSQTFNLGIEALDIYQDTLFIGGYLQPYSNKLKKIAKCINYAKTDNCSESIVGLSNYINKSKLVSFYPTPFLDKLVLKSSEILPLVKLTIYDALGCSVYTSEFKLNYQIEFELPQLSSGVYYAIVKANGHYVIRSKVIKN